MLDKKGKYVINCANQGNGVVLRSVWHPGKVDYNGDAQKVIGFLEAELPAGTYCALKKLLKCEVSTTELLKLQQRMYKIHQDTNDKNHECRRPQEEI